MSSPVIAPTEVIPPAPVLTAPPQHLAARAGPKPPRRWHRLAIPFGILLLLYLFAGVTHKLDSIDLTDPGTLASTGTGPDGSSELADALRARGVSIEYVTNTTDALAAMVDGNSVVFVPEANFMKLRFGHDALVQARERQRIVVVQPDFAHSLTWGAFRLDNRWAAEATEPGCSTSLAERAGRATAHQSSYLADPKALVYSCYAGGLVGFRAPNNASVEVVLVGSTDPFRNARIGEGGNRELALGLLGGYDRLIWVDVHRAELNPVNLKPPNYSQPNRQSEEGSPTWRTFPELWPPLALGAVLFVLLAFVFGRRLGAPVREPLPVVVPATETITGRGRLYDRIGARGATLETLRAATIRRILLAIDPLAGPGTIPADHPALRRPGGPLPPGAQELIAKIAERTGWPAFDVGGTLYGPPPHSDDDLVRATAQLDALAYAVLGPPRATRPAEPPTSAVTGPPTSATGQETWATGQQGGAQ